MNNFSMEVTQPPSPPPQAPTSPPSLKKEEAVELVAHWKIFPGRTKFCFDGRCYTSKNWPVIPCSLALLIIPACFHVGFDMPFLVTAANPVIAAVGVPLFILSLANYFLCAFTDPGFMPRATAHEAVHIEKMNDITVDLSDSYYPSPKNKTISIKDCEYDVKFCTTCKFYRPPRTIHCGTCNMCVERFDHHCPWVSNCVGRRNHKYFYSFLFFGTLTAIYAVAASATALSLRIKNIQPVGEALGWSVVSIIVGIYAVLVTLNVGGMCIGHTYYLINEYTTNERIKKRFKRKDNPFAQKNKFLNCVYMLCGPYRPSFFKFREKLPVNYYEKMRTLAKELRRINLESIYSSESLIPVPDQEFFLELLKKKSNDNQIFKQELTLLNEKYAQTCMNNEKVSTDGVVVIDEEVTPEKAANNYYQMTKRIAALPNLNFYFDGYECNKRYLQMSRFENKAKYWRFVYDCRITNIVLLEDRFNESSFIDKYSFLFDRTAKTNELGATENLDIRFSYAYRYTNFSMNIFSLSELELGNKDPKKNFHQVRIYRYWAYDPANNIPTESNYFLKMIQIINYNNPVCVGDKKFFKTQPYPQEDYSDAVANYVLYSENLERIYAFLLYDHVCDEFRLTNRFSVESGFKVFRDNLKYLSSDFIKNSENRLTKLTMEQYLFCYINSLCTINTNSDVALVRMKDHLTRLLTLGVVSKKPLIDGHYETLIKSAYVDRQLRSSFKIKSADFSDSHVYKFNLFDINDFTVIVAPLGLKSLNTDDLIEFFIENHVDLVIKLNMSDLSYNKSLKRSKLTRYTETKLNEAAENTQVQRIKIELEFEPLHDSVTKTIPYTFTSADVDQIEIKSKVNEQQEKSSVSKFEYSKGDVDKLATVLLNILNCRDLFHERIVLICSDERLAILFSVAIINMRQGQVEQTMNMSMACQSVMTKLPIHNYNQKLSPLGPLQSNLIADDLSLDHYGTYFKSMLDEDDYVFLFKVSAQIAENVGNTS